MKAKKKYLTICLMTAYILSFTNSYCQTTKNDTDTLISVPVSELRKANLIFIEYDYLKNELALSQAININLNKIISNMDVELSNEQQKYDNLCQINQYQLNTLQDYKQKSDFYQIQTKKEKQKGIIIGGAVGLIVGIGLSLLL